MDPEFSVASRSLTGGQLEHPVGSSRARPDPVAPVNLREALGRSTRHAAVLPLRAAQELRVDARDLALAQDLAVPDPVVLAARVLAEVLLRLREKPRAHNAQRDVRGEVTSNIRRPRKAR
jgi:hypothetical protein